jgi:hypothetical protein
MGKQLSWGGVPERPISLEQVHKEMGCATKIEEKTLLVATFGEWSGGKEGPGADITVVAIVPEQMELKRRLGLSGETSEATMTGPGPGDLRYGGTSLANGWTAVPDVPDPNQSAK